MDWVCYGCGRHFSWTVNECPYCRFQTTITTGGTQSARNDGNDTYFLNGGYMRNIKITDIKRPYENRKYNLSIRWDENHSESVDLCESELIHLAKLVEEKFNFAKVEKLIEALQFYADPNTYFAIGIYPDPPCGDFAEDFDETGKPGKLARDTLKAFNTER